MGFVVSQLNSVENSHTNATNFNQNENSKNINCFDYKDSNNNNTQFSNQFSSFTSQTDPNYNNFKFKKTQNNFSLNYGNDCSSNQGNSNDFFLQNDASTRFTLEPPKADSTTFFDNSDNKRIVGVKGKANRAQLKGQTCDVCKEFYSAICDGQKIKYDDHKNFCSVHRSNNDFNFLGKANNDFNDCKEFQL